MHPFARFVIACVCWCLAPLATGATYVVTMSAGNQFVPADLTIAAFDTVTWTNNDAPGVQHTSTSDPSSAVSWDLGPILPGASTSKTFGTTLGTFPYYSKGDSGMVGTITVVTTPTITSGATAHGTVNSPLTFAVHADQSPTSYGASGLPPGLTINTTTGVISGTPTTAAGSPYTANVSATNVAATGNASLTFTIDPLHTGAPSITSATAISGNVGGTFSYAITATNSPNAFDAAPLPAGLVIDHSAGLINGTPTTAGQSQVTISAGNTSGTATTTLTITIAPASGGSGVGGTATAGTTGYPVTGGGNCGAGGGTMALSLALVLGLARRMRARPAASP
jgi:plastocyanin